MNEKRIVQIEKQEKAHGENDEEELGNIRTYPTSYYLKLYELFVICGRSYFVVVIVSILNNGYTICRIVFSILNFVIKKVVDETINWFNYFSIYSGGHVHFILYPGRHY